MSGLGRNKINALVDILRRNFLYQTPRAVFENEGDETPMHVVVAMKPDAYNAMIGLITEHGGWDLTPEQKREINEGNTGNGTT